MSFEKNICNIVGHEYGPYPELKCDRCGAVDVKMKKLIKDSMDRIDEVMKASFEKIYAENYLFGFYLNQQK